MAMGRLHRKFVNKVLGHADRAQHIQRDIPHTDPWRTRLMTEALISDLWQSWEHFCRWLILHSCRGALSRNGKNISPRPADNSWPAIGYVAKHAALGHGRKKAGFIAHYRQEPTWGNRDKLIDIVQALRPANENQLITAMGLPLQGPTHLHRIRNACAHKNVESIQDVRALLPYYSLSHINTPSELAWDIVAGRSLLGIFSWIDDMIVITEEATLVR